MGNVSVSYDERPVHEVCVGAFWIDQVEVTNLQFGSSGTFSGDKRPRESVSWNEAKPHCFNRNRNGRSHWPQARLPTEAEWEYAARGPEGWLWPWGNEFDAGNMVYRDNSGGETADVGSTPEDTSWVGAKDMGGNVAEWVNSMHSEYPYDPSDGREADVTYNVHRVIRGSSWKYGNEYGGVNSAFRGHAVRWRKQDEVGFRCAFSIYGY